MPVESEPVTPENQPHAKGERRNDYVDENELEHDGDNCCVPAEEIDGVVEKMGQGGKSQPQVGLFAAVEPEERESQNGRQQKNSYEDEVRRLHAAHGKPAQLQHSFNAAGAPQHWNSVQATGILRGERRVRAHPHANGKGDHAIVDIGRQQKRTWLGVIDSDIVRSEVPKFADELVVDINLVGVIETLWHLDGQARPFASGRDILDVDAEPVPGVMGEIGIALRRPTGNIATRPHDVVVGAGRRRQDHRPHAESSKSGRAHAMSSRVKCPGTVSVTTQLPMTPLERRPLREDEGGNEKERQQKSRS